MKVEALIYDIEIEKAILGRNEAPIKGVEYCKGWGDHAGMGITVIGALEWPSLRPRVFCRDNLAAFLAATEEDEPLLVSFNGIGFDNKLLAANDIHLPEDRCYDILREMWIAAGLEPTFNFRTHGGYGLDPTCEVNFGIKKSGHGALAPVQWQRGEVGNVIDYCMNDVHMTRKLFQLAAAGQKILNPKNPEADGLQLTNPFPLQRADPKSS